MKNISLVLLIMFFITACNAAVSEVSESNSYSDGSSSVSNETVAQTADTNVRISFVQNGEKFFLNKNDKIRLELRNNITEVLNLAKIEDKNANCSSSIKKELSSLKKNSFILCNSYVKKLSLTNVFIERNGKKLDVKSWKFSNEDKELIDIEIKVN